jgi:hypothetical protein
MVVMSDVNNPFAPEGPDKLFRDPKSDESEGLENLLDQIPIMFGESHDNVLQLGEGALGASKDSLGNSMGSGGLGSVNVGDPGSMGGNMAGNQNVMGGGQMNQYGNQNVMGQNQNMMGGGAGMPGSAGGLPGSMPVVPGSSEMLYPDGSTMQTNNPGIMRSSSAGTAPTGSPTESAAGGAGTGAGAFVDRTKKVVSQSAAKAAAELLRVRGGTGKVIMFQVL